MAHNAKDAEVERAPVGWGFWLLWVLATAVGCFLAWFVVLATVRFGAVPELAVVAGAVGGVAVGALQWLVLRREVSGAGWWVLASAVGWGLGWAVLFAINSALDDVRVLWAVGGAVDGVVVGTLQWLVLRREVSGAGWWVLASTGALAVGWAVKYIVRDEPVALRLELAYLVGGVVAGAITGIALVWLLRQPLAPQAEAADEP